MTPTTRVAAFAVGIVLLAVPAARAVDKDEIKQSIAKGVDALKQGQGADGTWSFTAPGGFVAGPRGQLVPDNRQAGPDAKLTIGMTALAGLTLVECGVSPRDAAVRKAADVVRQSAVTVNDTYTLALGIMFLDLLGESDDVPMIQSMVVRLLAGQNDSGGWTYDCPPLDVTEARRLTADLKQRSELVARGKSSAKTKEPRDASAVAKEVKRQLRRLAPVMAHTNASDNSNTQFATLALWVARRHRLPVDKALARVEQRFRSTQNADGGWPYIPGGFRGGKSTASMTCAGLLGMAVGHGVAKAARDKQDADTGKPHRDPTRDPVVRAGLLALGSAIDDPVGRGGRVRVLEPATNPMHDSYYFLWSLERVGVAYGLDTIGKKDWYGWGAEILLASQTQDGSWRSACGSADTCFALLFLRRANLAKDLSATLRGKVSDPGQVTLRSGGVSGEGIQVKRLQPAIDSSTTKPKSDAPKARQVERPRHVQPAQPDDSDAVSGRLSAELVHAQGARQDEVIEKFKMQKGGEYTDALVGAIRSLDGEAREKVRDALAERLTRMTAATLRTRLKDADREMRSAAALACGMKEDKNFVPDLINLLTDADARVDQAARVALKSLTGKDFGPHMGASGEQRAEAVSNWRTWWRKQQGK